MGIWATPSCSASAGGLLGGGGGLWHNWVSLAEQGRHDSFPSSQEVQPLTSGGVWERFDSSGPQFAHLLKGNKRECTSWVSWEDFTKPCL